MNTIVSLSNIGAFVLQAVTLGHGFRSSTASIQEILEQARSELTSAREQLLNYLDYLEDSQINPLNEQFNSLDQNLENQTRIEMRRDGFLMTVETYKSAKARAKFYLTSCKSFKVQVTRASHAGKWAFMEREKAEKKKKQELEEQNELQRRQGLLAMEQQQEANLTVVRVPDHPVAFPPLVAVRGSHGRPNLPTSNNPFRQP